jgi:LCP family protein required for cell wall assembly
MADHSTGGRAAARRRAKHGGNGGIRASGRRRRPHARRRRAVKATVLTAVAAIALGGAGLGYAYFKLNGNISGVNVNAQLGKHRPTNVPNGSLDILVLGSDTRAGANAKYGGSEGGTARADTSMVVHVNKKHNRASVVSIPRDTIVQRPSCMKNDGSKQIAPAQAGMFNSSFQVGGPACTIKTVEHMSGVRMDHFVQVDFSGFKKLINTLGGVKLTTGKPIHDPDSHLNLDPGPHTLTGEQALGLVRTRHGVGDGSDLGRIQLQQAFVKALMKQVNHVGTLSSPKQLYNLADTATSAITTDSQLDSVTDLAGMAGTLKGLKSNDINMTTLPVQYDPKDPNRVEPMLSKDRLVWSAIKHDRPVPKSASKGSASDATNVHGVVK